jgi:hypothetical protein
MRSLGGEFLDPSNFCPDFELAIARGMGLLEEETVRKAVPQAVPSGAA